ncbi:hypothetical protein MJG53_004186 [Ovis ammon polii x Ovis aries]|uniref:Uncharacterized protein n=1 Tax=Ovis ammon polii x Ovis aries TaxID=2918886 RepID=A0ACB9V8X6_9CETA|nr:hypothetical protein MJG53_004186 [Ovis ammon polii x Ovis aries]
MASAKKVAEKRHNPVESICRKLRAIQKREDVSDPIRQITKYQSSSFDSPQTNPKKDFEGVLKKMMAAHLRLPDTLFLSPEKDGTFASQSQIVSPRTPSVSHLSSPENATYSLMLTSSENISRPRSQSSQNYTSLIPQIMKRELFANKDLTNYCSGNDFSALALDFDSPSDQSSTPQDSVVKKLSPNEEGWKQGTDDGKEDVTDSNNRTYEEELLRSIFNICDSKRRGLVRVTKIIDYLRQTTSQGSEDDGLEELWIMLDPEKRDVHVNLETFQATVKEWMMAHCRNKWEGENSGSNSRMVDSAFEQDSIKSCEAIKMATDITNSSSWNFKGLGGDLPKGVLEVPDLITYIADLHFNKQKLEDENNKLKLALENLEEANRELSEDCTELRLRVKSAHQAIMRTNLLKEELEELKISMNASEEQKTMTVAQNKQLETENRALILKIRILQEEKDVSIEELKSTILEYGSIIENLRGEKNKLALELQHLQQEFMINGMQLNVSGEHKSVDSEGVKSLHCELILAQSAEQEDVSEVETRIDHFLQWVTNPEITVKEKWENKLTKQHCHKRYSGPEARIHQLLLAFKHTRWYTPLLDALHLDSFTAVPRLELTPFSCVANLIHASHERPRYEEIEDCALAVTERHRRMVLNTYVLRASPNPDSGSEILHMASGDPDCKPLCEKEEDKRSASTVTKIPGGSPAPENTELQGSVTEEKSMLIQEAKKEPETIDEHRKECAAGGAALSSLPVKSVNFRQSDNTSANEKEVEAEFLRLSLAFKCDWFTLEKRVKLEERSRDLAEENLKKEITNCLKLLESLTSLCEDDSQAQEIIKKLEKSITFLSQCTTRVASRAEMLGAINQESRVSKAVEVMIQHVENLKRMYAKEHAELEELKQVLLQNERSFNPLEDEDDCQTKKRSSSVNSKPSSLRRVTIASLPRNIGNAGMLAGMENNERFSRRSSSWRILGSKQSEHRPSLHRFISTYSWADAEEEKCELKTKDDLEPPEEETVEKTRKPSLSEKKTNPSKWNVSSIYDTLASWATNLKTSIREANKMLWLSVAFIVLFAALMSFFTGRFFQKSVDAAPTQDADPWMSLEHILWPFTRLRHNGPPPV